MDSVSPNVFLYRPRFFKPPPAGHVWRHSRLTPEERQGCAVYQTDIPHPRSGGSSRPIITKRSLQRQGRHVRLPYRSPAASFITRCRVGRHFTISVCKVALSIFLTLVRQVTDRPPKGLREAPEPPESVAAKLDQILHQVRLYARSDQDLVRLDRIEAHCKPTSTAEKQSLVTARGNSHPKLHKTLGVPVAVHPQLRGAVIAQARFKRKMIVVPISCAE